MKAHVRTGIIAAAVAALATLAVGGCGSGGSAPAAKQVSMTTNSINPQPRSALRNGGTFVWPTYEFTNQWNYNQVNGAELLPYDALLGNMPNPFHFTATGTPYVNTDYVTSFTNKVSNGKQVTTYNLNTRAKWSDGTPITWRDYYWMWRANNGTNPAYDIASDVGYNQIQSVSQGASPYQVVVTYRTPYSDWQELFGFLYPASTDDNPNTFNNGWINKVLATAGPFKVASINQAAKTVTLVRDPNWWGQPAMLDKIVFTTLDVNAEASAYANGAIDFFQISGVNDYKRAQSVPDNSTRVSGGVTFDQVTLNGQSPVFSDVRVRQAFAEALNRAAISKAALAGMPWQAPPLDNHIYMNTQQGYQNNSGQIGTYDPSNAGKLLTQAGWVMNKDGYRYRNGKELVANTVIPADTQQASNEFTIMQQMEKAVGIKLELNAVPLSDMFTKYINTGQFDASLFGWNGIPFPISTNYSIYESPQGGDVYQNFARIGSKQVDSLFAKALAQTSHQQEIAVGNQIDKLLWQEVNVIPLFQNPSVYAVNKDVANFGAFGFADVIYQNIGFMKNPPKTSK